MYDPVPGPAPHPALTNGTEPPPGGAVHLPTGSHLREHPVVLDPGKTVAPEVADHHVRVLDNGDAQREDHVDEEADVGVEVDPGEDPDDVLGRDPVVRLHQVERSEHVVSVEEGEERLHGYPEGGELAVVGREDEPPTEDVGERNDDHADHEATEMRQSNCDGVQ